MTDLTRKQVARRLCRSIATVRRLEGKVLHPRRDARGVHQFSSEEVERLRAAPDRLEPYACSPWLQRKIASANRVRQERRGRAGTQQHARASTARIAQAVQVMVESAKPMRGGRISICADALDDLLTALTNEL
jgi:hypothetical protein